MKLSVDGMIRMISSTKVFVGSKLSYNSSLDYCPWNAKNITRWAIQAPGSLLLSVHTENPCFWYPFLALSFWYVQVLTSKSKPLWPLWYWILWNNIIDFPMLSLEYMVMVGAITPEINANIPFEVCNLFMKFDKRSTNYNVRVIARKPSVYGRRQQQHGRQRHTIIRPHACIFEESIKNQNLTKNINKILNSMELFNIFGSFILKRLGP